MELIVLSILLLVVAVRGATTMSLGKIQTALREAETEEAEVVERCCTIESSLRQLEQEKKALDQEEKLLENDKDLAALEITKLGATPISESEVQAQMVPTAPAVTAATPPPSQEDQPSQEGEQAASPHDADAAADTRSDPDQPPEAETAPQESAFRILLVDDNVQLRELLQQALSKNYEVVEAGDGLEALTKILKEKQVFDLVITDLKMPNIDGKALLENLPQGVPAIVISAFVKRPEFQKALERLEPVAVFEKPFQISTLREAIHQVSNP